MCLFYRIKYNLLVSLIKFKIQFVLLINNNADFRFYAYTESFIIEHTMEL